MIDVSLPIPSASFTGLNNGAGMLAASFSSALLTAALTGTPWLAGTFDAVMPPLSMYSEGGQFELAPTITMAHSAAFTAVVAPDCYVYALMPRIVPSIVGVGTVLGPISARVKVLTGSFSPLTAAPGILAGHLRLRQMQFSAMQGKLAYISADMPSITVAAQSWVTSYAVPSSVLPRFTADISGRKPL